MAHCRHLMKSDPVAVVAVDSALGGGLELDSAENGAWEGLDSP